MRSLQEENTVELHIRCTENEKRHIKTCAAKAGLSLSEYSVGMILKGKLLARMSSQEIYIYRQICGLRNNVGQIVNQIAKRLNEGQIDKIYLAMAEEILTQLDNQLNDLKKINPKQNETDFPKTMEGTSLHS